MGYKRQVYLANGNVAAQPGARDANKSGISMNHDILAVDYGLCDPVRFRVEVSKVPKGLHVKAKEDVTYNVSRKFLEWPETCSWCPKRTCQALRDGAEVL